MTQLAAGVLASCGAVWALVAFGLVAQSPGAEVTPLRALAVGGILTAVPVTMWTTRAIGEWLVRVITRTPEDRLDSAHRKAVERTLVECLRRESRGYFKAVWYEQQATSVYLDAVERALAMRDSSIYIYINALQLRDESEEYQRTVYTAVERFREAEAA